jgi:hypothetical protein
MVNAASLALIGCLGTYCTSSNRQVPAMQAYGAKSSWGTKPVLAVVIIATVVV